MVPDARGPGLRDERRRERLPSGGNPSRADAAGGRSLSGGGPQSLHPAVLRLDGTCRRRGRDGSPVAVGGGRGIPPCRYRYPAIRRSISVICRMWVRSSPCPPPPYRHQRKKRSARTSSSGKRDSNPRPSAWEADALPTELFPHYGVQSYSVFFICQVFGG